jgi:hypothetical protein
MHSGSIYTHWLDSKLLDVQRIAYSFVVVVGDGSFVIKETEVGELQVVHDGVMTELWPKIFGKIVPLHVIDHSGGPDVVPALSVEEGIEDWVLQTQQRTFSSESPDGLQDGHERGDTSQLVVGSPRQVREEGNAVQLGGQQYGLLSQSLLVQLKDGAPHVLVPQRIAQLHTVYLQRQQIRSAEARLGVLGSEHVGHHLSSTQRIVYDPTVSSRVVPLEALDTPHIIGDQIQ